MKISSILKHRLFIHLCIISISFILIIYIVLFGLDYFTLHGKSISVPDFSGITMDELDQFVLERELRYEIIDSVFDSGKEKGSVVAQEPRPSDNVKKGRKIYLTVVSTRPEQVKIPNLTDLTLRQAISILETYGLRVGDLDYIPNLAKNAVLKQKYKGEEIKEGTIIEKGAVIDLVLGEGLTGEKTIMPFLLGLTHKEAAIKLNAASLNLGAEMCSEEDTAHTRVIKTNPSYSEEKLLTLGQSIDIWYESEENFNFDSLLAKYISDSLVTDSVTIIE